MSDVGSWDICFWMPRKLWKDGLMACEYFLNWRSFTEAMTTFNVHNLCLDFHISFSVSSSNCSKVAELKRFYGEVIAVLFKMGLKVDHEFDKCSHPHGDNRSRTSWDTLLGDKKSGTNSECATPSGTFNGQ